MECHFRGGMEWGGMEGILTPRESARFIAENSRDVCVDSGGVRRVAELLLARAAGPELRVDGWKALHELNPRAADEAAVNWVFVVDTLNFSFWAEQEEHKCLVRYGGKTYSGYWSLCAAVYRALDEGIPITSASYYATVTLDQGKRISFYKRAQILVADTWSVLEGKGDGCFEDISSITMFADYRLPQILVYLGALKYSDKLLKKLLDGVMLSYGDKQEVEIRGCTVWCVELIRDCLLELIEKSGEKPNGEINSILLDYYLWDYARDHREDMKGIPFHRTRCIYY
ncbi:queuosine salvage protein isoform X2 [Dipodomys spectabilis]|uniref:queuosine salvage protein isoform X2 n=1 Tax=Dipodomys spectabilis TaxID=105255 RepID=UPI001C53F64D|nr:queuosine salvage protein isoform X2 [Dipodomys spectabilis]